MFKLVVLCAFLAAAVAEPEPSQFYQPLAYSSTVVSPAVTSISKSASSVIHPSPAYPFYYGTPAVYSHFIKKRSAPLYFPTTYAAGAPLVSTYSASILPATPLVHSAPLLTAPISAAPLGFAHLIKKRSAPLIPYTAYSPLTYSTPLIAPTPLVNAAPLYTAPVISHAPLAVSHLIKKRSAPLLASTYIAPAALAHQTRIGVVGSPLISTYSAPLAYPSPYAYTRLY